MKNIKLKRNTILTSLLIITLCFLNIILCSNQNSSALTYSSNVEVGFTFDPTISINLSGDLLINNLAPGSTADSNIVSLTVATNNQYGYTLLATAGTSSTNTNLTNTTNSSYKFTSISTSADLSSLTTNNTWGFSYSTNNGTNWSNYTGLPKDNNDEGATGKQLARTTSQSDNLPIRVKIGAKAGSDQAAGTYTNVINFYAVANVSSGRNYTVNYIDPSGEAIGIPAQQTGTTNNNQITLSDTFPITDDSYDFHGWCTTYDGYSIYPEWCDGEEYDPGDTITVTDGVGDIIVNLYTTWTYTGGIMAVTIENDSDADLVADYYRNIGPQSIETIYYSLMDYFGTEITVNPPSSCPQNWSWSADVEGFDTGDIEHYSGVGVGSFSFNMNQNTIVNVTGSCGT